MNHWFKSQVHICLVGALVLSLGISSLISMGFGWFKGEGGLDFGFLLIFIGLGLLRGSALQRSLFGGLLALGLVLSVVILIISLAKGALSSASIGWETGGQFVVFGIFLYGFFVLWNVRNDSWFSEKFSGKGPRFVIPVTVVLTILFSISKEVFDLSKESALDEIYRYDFDVMVRDGETGELIDSVAVTYPSRDFKKLKVPRFMRVVRSSSPSDERSAANIQGYARGEVKAFVEKEGYRKTSINVNRDTGAVVEVVLEPTKER